MFKKLASLVLMASTLIQGSKSDYSMFGFNDPCAGVNSWDSTNSFPPLSDMYPDAIASAIRLSKPNAPFDDDLFGHATGSFYGEPSANKPKVINLIYNPGGVLFTDMPGPWIMEYKLVSDDAYASVSGNYPINEDHQGLLNFLVNRCNGALIAIHQNKDCNLLSNLVLTGGLSSSSPDSTFFSDKKCHAMILINGDRDKALELADWAQHRSGS